MRPREKDLSAPFITVASRGVFWKGRDKSYLLFASLSLALFAFAGGVRAASIFDIQFPIPELGGCADQNACKAYCDDPTHIDECAAFGEQHGFVDKDHAKIVKKILGKGPGGCRGNDECRAYCDDPSHQSECIDFAEKNGIMTSADAQRARKFAGKTGPGGCRGEQCRDFCNAPGNEEQCLDFAEREGILPKEELARARKFMAASRDGGPGGCRGEQCRDFCQDPSHHAECFDFAKKQGLISKEEERQFEAGSKIQDVVKQSGGPGGCKNDDECRTYCADPAHVEECVAFGAAHGGVPPEQARAMLKQFTEKRFSAQGGADEFGQSGFDDFKKSEQQSNRRFEEFQALEQEFRGKEFPGFSGGSSQGQQGQFPRGGGFPGKQSSPSGENQKNQSGAFAGPGGCASPTECIKYCTEHKQECFGASDRQSPAGAERENGQKEQQKECCPAPGGTSVRLRSNLIHEFNKDQLPADFQQVPQEEREKLFHDKFPQFNPPSSGQSPGKSQEGFPGRNGEFRGAPGEFPGGPGGNSGGFPGRQGGSGESRRQNDMTRGQEPGSPEKGSFPRPQEGTLHPPERSFNQPQSGTQSGSFPQQSPPPQGSSAGSFQQPSSGNGTSLPSPTGAGAFNQSPPGSFSPPPPSGGSFSSPPPGGSISPPPSGGSGSFSSPPPPSGNQSTPPPPSGLAPLLKSFSAVLNPFTR